MPKKTAKKQNSKTKGKKINALESEPLKLQKLIFIREIAGSLVGKNAGAVIDLLFDRENVNEFLIAEKLGLTINQTRNVLYKLSDNGLVSFARKKDKKKGWYTYFWTLNPERGLSLLKESLLKEIRHLEMQLRSREIKQFYICKICKSEIAEENALLHNFTCPECGEIYELSDSSDIIKDLNNSLNKLRKKTAEIDEELEMIEKKRIEKQEKETEKKKAEKKKARKKMMGNLARKTVKKAKKPVKKAKTAKKKSAKKPVKKAVKKVMVKKSKKAIKKSSNKK